MVPCRLRVLIAAALTAAALPAVGSALPATAGTAMQRRVEYVASAVRATNEERVERNRGELDDGRCLRGFAARQAKAMADSESMYHQDLAPVLRICDLAIVGENVAYGFATGESAVLDGWMRSESHRHNLLSKEYTRIAIAARRSAAGTWYVSQMFGRPA